MRKKLVAGNWKMHGSRKMADGLVREIVEGLEDGVDVLVIPPMIYLADLVHKYGDRGLGFGAQTISEHPEQGAFTGEISGSMVRDVGAKWTLVGHSERRQYYHETDALLSKKFRTACDAGRGSSRTSTSIPASAARIAEEPCSEVGANATISSSGAASASPRSEPRR